MGRQSEAGEAPRLVSQAVPGDASAPPVPPVAHGWFWGLVAGGVLLDLVTKTVAFRLWPLDGRTLHGPTVIPGFLYITTRCNPGMAWSMGRGLWWPILALVPAGIAGYVG